MVCIIRLNEYKVKRNSRLHCDSFPSSFQSETHSEFAKKFIKLMEKEKINLPDLQTPEMSIQYFPIQSDLVDSEKDSVIVVRCFLPIFSSTPSMGSLDF